MKRKNYPEINIRKAGREDSAQVGDLLIKTWIDSFSAFIPESDLKAYHAENYSLEKIDDMISSGNDECYVAETAGAISGWLRLKSEKKSGKFYLSQLYINPNMQGGGIGNKLLKLAEEKCKENGFSELWIGVFSENEIALKLYEKCGFVFKIEEPFKMGQSELLHKIGVKDLSV